MIAAKGNSIKFSNLIKILKYSINFHHFIEECCNIRNKTPKENTQITDSNPELKLQIHFGYEIKGKFN